jgi:hypothetical protein
MPSEILLAIVKAYQIIEAFIHNPRHWIIHIIMSLPLHFALTAAILWSGTTFEPKLEAVRFDAASLAGEIYALPSHPLYSIATHGS